MLVWEDATVGAARHTLQKSIRAVWLHANLCSLGSFAPTDASPNPAGAAPNPVGYLAGVPNPFGHAVANLPSPSGHLAAGPNLATHRPPPPAMDHHLQELQPEQVQVQVQVQKKLVQQKKLVHQKKLQQLPETHRPKDSAWPWEQGQLGQAGTVGTAERAETAAAETPVAADSAAILGHLS